MRRTVVFFAFAMLAAGCTSTGYGPQPTALPSGVSASASIPGVPTAVPQQAHESGHVFGTMPSPCRIRMTDAGPLPDPACTPGSVDPDVGADVLCDHMVNGRWAMAAWWRDERAPSSETSKVKYGVVADAYGVDPHGDELDHLDARELAGTNSLANLWPEPGGIPNAKDKVENALHSWVCAVMPRLAEANTRLRAAQAAIAYSWTSALQRLGV